MYRAEGLKPTETLDGLFQGALKIIQRREGYRFSVDAPLLASFVRLKRGERVVDLGTGSGVILLILAKRYPQVGELVGVEIQQELVELARRNVILNEMEGLIRIVHGDIRGIKNFFDAGSFDVVVSNPPYYPLHERRSGYLSQRAMARHEVAGGIREVMVASSYLLREGGRGYFIYPSRRAATLIHQMREARLEPKRMRWVHSFEGEPAKMVMVQGVKGAGEGLEVEPPLFIFRSPGEYTQEMETVLFRLKEGEEDDEEL